MDLEFKCLRCGKCCHEIPKEIQEEADPPSSGYKRIPIFPEEADILENLAKTMNIPLRIIEDLVFPDIKNKKILVLTYRIMLDNDEKVCPFWKKNQGCLINSQKPLACQAYPLAIKTEDAFNMQINIDPLCMFTIENRPLLNNLNFQKLLSIYKVEFGLAKNLLKRSKQAILSLMEKQQIGEIEIPLKIQGQDYNNYIKEWDRVIIQ